MAIRFVSFFALMMLAFAVGCYPHQGKPLAAPPGELIESAQAACQRHDRRAYETLLERVRREYPNSTESKQAAEMLENDEACLPPKSNQSDSTDSPP